MDIYNKVINGINISFNKMFRVFCIVIILVSLVTFVGGCNGCKKKTAAAPSKHKDNGQESKFTVEMDDYQFLFPASNERQLKIVSRKGKAESQNGPYMLSDITVSVIEKGEEVSTITAKNCKADINGDIGTARITGNVRISAKDKTNKIVINTDEVTWKSDSSMLNMKEFEIDLNEKGILKAINGEISTDLKSFKYDDPRLEIK